MRDVGSRPNRGVWKPWNDKGLPHDFTTLAIWMNRDNAEYIRDIYRDKKGASVSPPFHRALATELGALEWLSKNTTLGPELQKRLEELRSEASIIRIPAKKLLAEYKNNEVRADGLYKGKIVEVTGIVQNVSDTTFGGISVSLGAGGRWELQWVVCSVAREQSQDVTKLNKGDRARVRGTVKGLLMHVLLEECRLISYGGARWTTTRLALRSLSQRTPMTHSSFSRGSDERG